MKLLLVLLVVATSTLAQDLSKWTPLQCRAGTLGPNDDRMKDIGACPPGDCAYFCQGKALGLLHTTTGLPTTQIYDKWVKDTFPQRHHGVATAWFRDCYAKYGKFIDKSDASCKFAKQFGDCTWQVQPHLTCPKV